VATPASARVPAAGLFSSPEKRNLILGLLLVLSTLALYNPVTHHPFVNFDDDRYVTDNANVRAGLHWQTVRWAFSSYDEANWHPLTWLSHALDCQIFGLNPAGPHYINVLLHALNAALLFWLLWQATGLTARSLMVAALFALHPINVESVAWIAERKNVLSMMFFLLALMAYRWYAQKPAASRYLAVAAMFACGLMAKPMIITLPCILLLWDYWPLRRTDGARFSQLVLEKVPLFLISAGSALLTVKAQRAGEAIGSMVQYPFRVRIDNVVVSYARYLGKAFWPVRLAPMYPLRQGSLRTPLVVASFIVLLAVTALVIRHRQRRYLLVGWLWFVGSLVPMIGLIQVGSQAMADRYAYLPFLGLFIMVCWGAADIASELRLPQAYPATAAAICLLALAIVSHRQINYWGDNVTLWSHTLQVTMDSFVAEDNLGGALLERGKVAEAVPHFREAAALHPADPMSRLNIAADAQRQGHLAEAVEQYNRLLLLTDDPRLRATALSDLGYAYRGLGDLPRARESFQASVNLRPSTVRAWLGLGLLAQKTGDYAEAVRDYSQVVVLQPSDLGYYFLARALEQDGKTAESQSAMDKAKHLTPDFHQLQQVADSFAAN
jgi:protein O-mannosyl-transferase